MWSNLSYRLKVPLSLSLAILLTGFVVAVVLIWRAYADAHDEHFRNAVGLGRALSNSLSASLKHDDPWWAYEVLEGAETMHKNDDVQLFLLLDDNYRVYVSNQPNKLPMTSELRVHGAELARLEQAVIGTPSLGPYAYERPEDERIYAVVPVVDNGIVRGTLVMGTSRSVFIPRFVSIVWRVTYSSLLVMAVLLPAGWYLGKRMVSPLMYLASCMDKAGKVPLEEIECSLFKGKDEIGHLATRFRQMLQELAEKHRLESEMVVSERLAALGRLASGVAHEINNPLGGMLNAINTFGRYGHADPVTQKTSSLLQRGLEQIQQTVSALLVEARSESHALTPQDIEDVRTLVQPEVQKKAVRLVWENKLHEPLPLPSTQIRQILINLSLNAVQAAAEGGNVACSVDRKEDLLCIQVENDGAAIRAEDIPRLFEPFAHHNPSGSGLGLWVTYQIVQQLQGEILVGSEQAHTSFAIKVPLEVAA